MGKDYVSCSVMGRVVADPEMRFLPNGTGMTKARVAVSDDYFDKNTNAWVNRSDFFNFTIWGDRAQGFAEKVRKGSRVLIEFRPRNNNYEKDGKTVYQDDFVVVNYYVIDKSEAGADERPQEKQPPKSSGKPPRQQEEDTDIAPF